MYNLALLNTEQDIVHKMDFTDVINLLTAAKTRKTVLNCSFSKDLQFWISFSSISGPKIILLSVQFEKILFFQFLRLLHCKKMSYMNIKLRFQVVWASNFSSAPGPMWS